MPTAIIDVQLEREKVLKYYQGIATRVKGYSRDGQSMDLPIDIFLRYVAQDGIYGTFEITYNDDGKFKSINKVR